MEEPIIALQPGERLLWSGRPQRTVLSHLERVRLVVGTGVVALFAVVGFPIGLVFVPPALVVIWGPVLWRLETTRSEVYAVTDRRIVVADGATGYIRTWTDLGLPSVTPIGRDGLGTLTFPVPGKYLYVFGRWVPAKHQPAPIELFAVPDAEGIRALIVAAQAEA